MRVLLGIILGALLTVGGAYLYNSHHTAVRHERAGTGATAAGQLGRSRPEMGPPDHTGARRVAKNRQIVLSQPGLNGRSLRGGLPFNRPVRACRRAAR